MAKVKERRTKIIPQITVHNNKKENIHVTWKPTLSHSLKQPDTRGHTYKQTDKQINKQYVHTQADETNITDRRTNKICTSQTPNPPPPQPSPPPPGVLSLQHHTTNSSSTVVLKTTNTTQTIQAITSTDTRTCKANRPRNPPQCYSTPPRQTRPGDYATTIREKKVPPS